MIAIASGLLSSLETVAASVAKKDGGSGGFAAAFEEVAAKDVGTAAQSRVTAQSRRVAGGGSGRGQAGLVAGRGSRAVGSSAKVSVAKAAEDVAAGSPEDLKGAVEAGDAGKTPSPARSDAAKPGSVAKLVAGDFVEDQQAGQQELAAGEARVGGASRGEEGVVRGGAKRLEGKGSTGVASPGALARSSLQGVVESIVSAGSGTGAVPQVSGVATPELSTLAEVHVASVPSPPIEIAAVAEGVSAKAVVSAAANESGNGDAVLVGAPGVAPQLQDGIADETWAAARQTGSVRPLAADRPLQTSSNGVGNKASQVDGASATSAARPGLQTASGTVPVSSTDATETAGAPLVSRGAGVAVAQKEADAVPVVEAKQTTVQPVTIAGKPVDVEGERLFGIGSAPLAVQLKAGLQEGVPQQVSAQAVLAQPAKSALEQAARQQTVAQGAAFKAPTPGQPVANTAQVTAQKATQDTTGSAQAAAPQLQAGPVGTEKVQTPLAETQQVGNGQTIRAEDGLDAQKQVLGASDAAEALRRCGRSDHAGLVAGVDAERDKRSSGIAAGASGAQKKVVPGIGESSSGFATGVTSTATNALVSEDAGPSGTSAATVQTPLVASIAEKANNASKPLNDTKGQIASVPLRGASASPMMAGTVVDPVKSRAIAQDPDGAALETTGAAGQTIPAEGGAGASVVSAMQSSFVPVASAVPAEVAPPQAGLVTGASTVARERRTSVAEGKAAERTSAEAVPVAQPLASQHPAGQGADTAKPSGSLHATPVEPGVQSVASATASSAAGVASASATQVVTHSVVPQVTGTGGPVSGLVQSTTSTTASTGLASSGADSLMSPMAHTTLQATPTVLEVGVPGGTHGWLKIRAEIGEGGTVQASMSAATHEGAETLRRELPAMNAFLDSEHVPVSVQVAAHGVSGAGSGSIAAASVSGADAGFNLGSGLSQDAGSGRNEAQAGLFAGGDGARQGNDGSQEDGRAMGAASSGRGAVSAEADWMSSSNADPGSGYGSGVSANGGSWLNVMA